MSLKLSIITVLYFDHGKFQKIIHFCLADPVPHLDPGCHFDMMCICEKHIILSKGHAGSRWGTYLEINYKIVNYISYALCLHFVQNKLQNAK